MAVIGGGNSAIEDGLFLVKFVEKVTLLVRGEKLTTSQILQDKALSHPKIEVRFNTEVTGFDGSGGKLKSVMTTNIKTCEAEEIHPAGVFIFIGQTPNTKFLKDCGIQLDNWGFIVSGHILVHGKYPHPTGFGTCEPRVLETNIPGIFTAGDVRAGSTK